MPVSNGRKSGPFEASPLEDDGTIDLALMASEHPQIKSCGAAMLESLSVVNELLGKCAPWISSGDFPSEATLEANKEVLSALSKSQGDIQKLDDIDMDALKPEWGDRDSVRMARKSIIGFAEGLIARLESLKAHLADPVTKFAPRSTGGTRQQETTFYGWELADSMDAKVSEKVPAEGAAPAPSKPSRSRSPRGRRKTKASQDGEDASENSDERRHNRDTPHFEWTKGEKLGASGRYVVKKEVGEGSFGRVLACVEESTKQAVAVKVVKGVARYKEHAEAEAEVLREILRCDPGRQSYCVKLLGQFTHAVLHCCLIFELLDKSLSDFMRDNDDRGMMLRDIRTIASQTLQCLHFLSAMGLTHTDIKCRNVMLKDARAENVPHPRREGLEVPRLRKCEVRVIDFGGAVFKKERHRRGIGTRQYRAPEIVIGLPWDEKIDVWSLGCILLTLYTGERPFPVITSLQHLALMERVLGSELPKAMLKAASSSNSLPEHVSLDSRGSLRFHGKVFESEDVLEKAKPLLHRILPQHATFTTLLEGLLRPDPQKRLPAEEALQLPFVASASEVNE